MACINIVNYLGIFKKNHKNKAKDKQITELTTNPKTILYKPLRQGYYAGQTGLWKKQKKMVSPIESLKVNQGI